MLPVEIVLAGLRGLHLATLLSLFGTLVFVAAVAPPALAMAPDAGARLRRGLRRLGHWSVTLALVFGAAWFVVQAAAIGGTEGVGNTLAVLPVVALHTRFGQVVLLRAALLLVVVPLIGRADRVAAGLAGLALVLQGELGHAGAAVGAEGTDLLISETVHLLAAGAWLGSLVPLWRSLAILPPTAAALACRRFSPIGMAAVLLLGGTGLFQGLELIGSVPSLVGTDYGLAALTKLGLFGLMLVLAMYNRLSLTDRLAADGSPQARRRLGQSILAETVLALVLVAAAATLASLTPAVHEQPVWPFSWRPSLTVLTDPDLKQEVGNAVMLVGLGVAAVAASLIWRRGQIVAWIVLAVILVNRLPSLELLLVEAYPTSFYTSPTGFAASGIAQGQALFATHCASCHGATGDGPAAAGLRDHPADLTAAHLLEHADGDLFWWLAHGIEDPEGGMAMPGFADQLNEAQRWALIDFVRANNAGAAMRDEGQWPEPMRAPALPVVCTDPAIADMAALRRQVVEVIADSSTSPEPPAIPPQDGVRVVRLHLADGARRPDCTVETPDAWRAYAVLAGLRPEALAGTAFLVDPNGWLRAVRRAGDGPSWTDPALLIAEVRQICEHPISTPAGDDHEHHHP
ncbi:MAG: CopD family protein [Acetobacteraceae bacterium]|nr:CopD family protein [Acetobacteraceae bacterium]